MITVIRTIMLALLVAVPAAAHEGLPDAGDDGLIHACTKTTRRGKLRLKFVAPAGTCRAQWTPVHWPVDARVDLPIAACLPTEKLTWTGTTLACAPDEVGGPPPGTVLTLTVTGSALRPREGGTSAGVGAGGACTYVESGDIFNVWNTPVVLPAGSLVRMMRIHYDDTSASNSTAWFTKYDLAGNIVVEYSASTADAAGPGSSDSGPIDETLDYDGHGYLLNWRPQVLGATMQLCAIQLFYELPPE